ncbi:MAG: hypothetical protein MJB57_14360 [Gemmatimonadetes bacterium]|nr:hypothetical protein [Gemmatimonadota bacterium]
MTPAADSRRLRVGLLMDSYDQPAWVVRMLERIQAGDSAELAYIVMNDGVPAGSRPKGLRGRLGSYWKNRDKLLYLLFQRLDKRRRLTKPDAFATVDTSDLLEGVPVLAVTPRRTKFSDYVSDEDVETVREQELDVLLRLGFRILRGGILESAEAGVWSFHHGDNRVNRGGPAGFWEVLLEWPVTGSILQILNEDLDNGLVLARSWSGTEPVSVRANKNNYYWKTLSMVPRKLDELHRSGTEAFLAEHRAARDPASFYSKRLFLAPTNRELWRPFVRLYRRLFARKLSTFTGWNQWQLRFGLGEGFGTSLWRFESVVPPADRFWADPHVIERDGVYHVFLEEYLYDPGKGRIAHMTIDDAGEVSEPRPVLERPYHLSYPFVFEHDASLYMIPESCEARTIELYRCDRFPDAWSLERVLSSDIDAVDATLVEHEGHWWMFANVRESEGASYHDELFVFWTDDPIRGEWRPHAKNPVISDVRRARPAGAFVRVDGDLIRPSQDCARRYGWGIRLNRVEVLTPDRYEETELALITPEFQPDVVGAHSFAQVGRLTMVDVDVRRRGSRQRR